MHRTFQDYLGAKAAVEDGDFGLLVRGAADEQWADVVRMAMAHARPRERAELLRDLSAAAERAEGAVSARLRLLALASLEHATELDPRVRAEVERNAASLIPPRTTEEARALASVGPLALELLPGPAGLDPEEARAVVVTASLIGTEAALPVLARFREHPGLDVRAQLSWSWSRFPTRRYGEEIIGQLPQEGLFFSVRSAEQLRFLRELGGRGSVQLVGGIAPDEIGAGLNDTTSELVVRDNDELRDLSCLSGLDRLVYLDVNRCSSLESLAALARLPLIWLSLDLLPRELDLTVLSGSPTLDQLDLGILLEGESLGETLPRDLNLRYLRFTKHALELTGLRGLHRFASLRRLSLGKLTTSLSPADHEEVARLPELEHLHIDWQHNRGWQGPPLPGVTHLRLNNFQGTEDLSAVPALFPSLRSATVVHAPDVTEIPEAALATLPSARTFERIRRVV